MAVTETFSLHEAAKFSRLTTHMVNYLCRQGVVEPSGDRPRGRGRWRAYTFGDVVMLRALAGLLESGVSVANLKSSLQEARKCHPEITPSALPSNYLVSDGTNVFFWEQSDVLEALDGSGQLVFAFVVQIERVRDEVLQAMETG